ncbi:MAG: hypothetical protein RIS09_750 [Actinomycetota bacterium]|jgi:hypothetical protein
MKSRITYFLVGLFGAIAVSSANATPTAVYNDPYSGYVLCVNKSTKVVTYPAKLKCPSGFRKLELGAQGADGAPGPSGPAGISTLRWAVSSAIDIVADGYIGNSNQMVRQVLLHVDGSSSTSARVYYTANIQGNWSDSAQTGDLIQCYFQSPADYNANNGITYWGGSEDENYNWNTIRMSVSSSAITSTLKVYLVCRTSGTVRDLTAFVQSVPVDSYQTLNVYPNP